MKVTSLLRFGITGLFIIVILPVVSEFVIEIARQNGIYDNPNASISSMLEWVSTPANYFWYQQFVVGLGGLLVGIWVDALARRADAKRPSKIDRAKQLGRSMSHFEDAMKEAHRRTSSSYAPPEAFKVYTDFAALQISLNKFGVQTPWIMWDHQNEPPKEYLEINIAYLAMISPLLRLGHVSEAKKAAKLLVKQIKSGDHVHLPPASRPRRMPL